MCSAAAQLPVSIVNYDYGKNGITSASPQSVDQA